VKFANLNSWSTHDDSDYFSSLSKSSGMNGLSKKALAP
jgi:hypothetical protein